MTAEVELAPGGVMTAFGREDLDDQAMGGLVGWIPVEQLIGDRPRLVEAAKLERPPPGHERNPLPLGLQPLARRAQPVFVDIVREELARPKLEDDGNGLLHRAARPWRLGAEQVEGHPQAVEVEVQALRLERDPAGAGGQVGRDSKRATREMERLAEIGSACLGVGTGPQGLGRGFARDGMAGRHEEELHEAFRGGALPVGSGQVTAARDDLEPAQDAGLDPAGNAPGRLMGPDQRPDHPPILGGSSDRRTCRMDCRRSRPRTPG